MITSLNVVGNGFDLAHNLPTTYQDFTGRCYDKSPSLQKFKSIIESSTLYTKTSEELIVEWNDFETVIGHITNQYFYDSMEHSEIMGYSKSEEIFKKKLTILYEVYEGIIQDFTEYLEGIPLNKVEVLPNVVPYFREGEYTVNFNYTDTVSAYQKSSLNISHVHGSLKEEEKIVLGFQPQMIRSDFEDPFSSRYNKRKLRDMLFFKRFLKEKYGNLTTDDFSKEVELYQKVIDMSDTGKGYDEKNDISSTYTREFRQIRKSWNLEEKFLTSLRQVVIFGHSLKADEDFFHYIFERSKNIKSIVLFTYQGEPLAQIREKEKLLQKFFGENPGIATCNFKMIPYRLNN